MLALLQAAAETDAGDLDPEMLMGQLGVSDGQLPKRAALLHRLINAAPAKVREQLLVLFIGELFS